MVYVTLGIARHNLTPNELAHAIGMVWGEMAQTPLLLCIMLSTMLFLRHLEGTIKLDSSRIDVVQVIQGLQHLMKIVILLTLPKVTALQQHDLPRMTCKEQSNIE